MRAIVYVRSSTPRIGFAEFGHVGWGFETQPRKFNIGSVENTKGGPVNVPAHKKDFWCINTMKPHFPFGVGPKDPVKKIRYPGYDMFKEIEVPEPNVKAALAKVREVSREPYNLIGGNCMDATYKILKAYGAPLPRPSDNWEPIKFFKKISTRAIVLQDSKSRIDFSLYEHPNFEGDSVRFSSNNKIIKGANVHYAGREVGDCVSSINIRRGRLRVFEHPNFEGHFLDFKGPYIVPSLKRYGFDNKISSFQAWR